jgi:hypothetical protein
VEAIMAKDSHFGELPETRRVEQVSPGGRHPLFGALKDVTFVPPGVDLTEPADPDWGKVYENGNPDRTK